ncbi:MAG: VOC family protein [Terriglobales bacterium]
MQATPYLHFNGDCLEAFRSYEKTLGGKIEAVHTYAQMPPGSPPMGQADKIMHASFRAGSIALMGSDAPPAYYRPPEGFRVCLSVDTPEEADRLFAALSAGGKVEMPIQSTFFSRRFAMFSDRFGVPWMVNCASEENRL